MPMWILFFVLAVIAACIIVFHITLEFNVLEKKTDELFASLKDHYGIE
jgi:hypothetical protein